MLRRCPAHSAIRSWCWCTARSSDRRPGHASPTSSSCPGPRRWSPSLLGVARAAAPQWRHVPEAVRAATAGTPGPIALIGHSGAGPLLPTIADALTAEVAGLVFVDSFLPPPSGRVDLGPPGFMDQLRGLASDGMLAPWSSLFGEDAMRELVPDDQLRAALEDEMPSLPLSYFDATVPYRTAERRRAEWLGEAEPGSWPGLLDSLCH